MLELLFFAWVLSELTGGRSTPPPTPTPTPATPPPGTPPPFPPPAPPVPTKVPIPVPATPPPGTPPTPPPATPPPAAAATYTIRKGDTPFMVAQRFTGQGARWKELLSSNPSLTTETVDVPTQTKAHPEGEMIRTTYVRPFDPGQLLTLPASWPPTPAA